MNFASIIFARVKYHKSQRLKIPLKKGFRSPGRLTYFPVGNITGRVVCRSVFLTMWPCIWSAELTKTHSFRLFYWRFCPLGNFNFRCCSTFTETKTQLFRIFHVFLVIFAKEILNQIRFLHEIIDIFHKTRKFFT